MGWVALGGLFLQPWVCVFVCAAQSLGFNNSTVYGRNSQDISSSHTYGDRLNFVQFVNGQWPDSAVTHYS